MTRPVTPPMRWPMRIIFSRKGFDSSAGGGPSPIVMSSDGSARPISLPIPDSKGASRTTYDDLGLGEHAAHASRSKLSGQNLCHNDPMFVPGAAGAGECFFGQCGAAQTHLERQGVGIGDVFVFFGLFADSESGEPHHRIFGYLRAQQIIPLADGAPPELQALDHPHAIAMHASNDVIWRGEGQVAARASDALRLTIPGGPPSMWRKPAWLKPGGLSYHDRASRWAVRGQLQSVARGQEFVADIGRRQAPREWLAQVIAEITAT